MEKMNLRNQQRVLLINLRSKLIGSTHTLPFTIYSDETIEDLLDAQPTTLEELSRVKGFPKEGKRVKGFGEYVCLIFKDTQRLDNAEISEDSDGFCIKPTFKKMNMF